MKITFIGAAKTVTGSCYFVETNTSKFLVDCGMFQGNAKESSWNEQPFPFNPADLDYIFLTHAHIDHSGRIPKVFLDGFKGEVIATKATVDLCKLMLPDSGHIQEIENEWINRKRQRAGKPPVKPLYSYQDALDCLKLFRGVAYGEELSINDDIRIRFNDAGHILGSAIIELWVVEDREETKIVFSGDLGNKNMPILRDPSIIESADFLVIESTYGNRLHTQNQNKVERFIDIINETIDNGGNVVIPSFAVGRTQELIYDLNKNIDIYKGKIGKLHDIPVFVDSPLATSATQVFRENLDCFDEEAREYIANGDNPLDFKGLQFTQSADESRALNEKTGSMIIISASGMCEAGRIKHHLKHNLWRKECTILFVGYQAVGTLGRKIVDGAKKVKIFGEEISVNARIEVIDGFSGHADRDGLLEWIHNFRKKPLKVFIVHGEEEVMNEFSGLINNTFNIETIIPGRGESYIVNAKNVVSSIDRPQKDYTFERLGLLDLLENLREEMEEAHDLIKNDLKQEKSDIEVYNLKTKLLNVEKAIIDLLK